MRKTGRSIERETALSVDTKELKTSLGCGRESAVRIGRAAGAEIRIGRRVLWNLSKIQKYLDSVSE